MTVSFGRTGPETRRTRGSFGQRGVRGETGRGYVSGSGVLSPRQTPDVDGRGYGGDPE